MKRFFLFIFICITGALLTWADNSVGQVRQDTSYLEVSRDSNSRVWQKTTYEQGSSGQVVARVHEYTELATGLHYWKGGQWLESKEQIDILPQGGAEATHGQHQVYFPADIFQDPLEIITEDGVHLRGQPMGISYDDGTNTVLIAQLKNSVGQLVGSNQVVYADAFTGVKADLVCTYRRSGFESDVVFREQPPKPEGYGLNPQTSKLQVLTEFFDTPEPKQISKSAVKSDGLTDTTLQFGKTIMGHGKAFSVGGTNSTRSDLRVFKEWLHLNGRTFLVEQLPYQRIRGPLQSLPIAKSSAPVAISMNSPLHKVSASRLLVPPRTAQKSINSTVQMSRADIRSTPGVVLDYTTINADQTDFTFTNGATYYVTGPFSISGTTMFQGAIIKYAKSAGAKLTVDSVACDTTGDQPVIFTSVDDDSVGEQISGISTGSPAMDLSTIALDVEHDGNTDLQHLRIAYAGTAIYCGGDLTAPSTNTLRDVHILHSQNGFDLEMNGYDQRVEVYNGLISDAVVAFTGYFWGGIAEHLTVDGGELAMDWGYGQEGVLLTNCILANIGSFDGTGGEIGLDGAYNGFFNCQTNSPDHTFGTSAVVKTGPSPFTSSGGATYYLTVNGDGSDASSFRDQGTTGINADLLSAVQSMTTYAPQDGGYADTNAPDLGYHYPINEDSDYDGLPDWSELKYFGNYSQSGTNDFDGDGLSNRQEYLNGSDPTDFYNGVLPNVTIVNGNNQPGMPNTLLQQPLTISVSDTNGNPLTNAPIDFVVTSGGSQISTATNGTFSSIVSVRTGTKGQVGVFMLLPSTLDTSISATATAWSGSSSNQVSFAENTMTGVKMWLRADAGITNSSVNVWFDQTTNHNDAAQTTGANQPLLVTNVLNGKSVVRFSASSNQFFSLPNVLLSTTQAEAVVVLKVATNVPSTRRSLWRMNTGGGGYPDNLGRIVDDFGISSGFAVGVPAQPLNQYHLYEVSAAANHWSAWVNGVLQANLTASTYGFTTTPTLGRDNAFSPTTYFDGDIAEVLIFNRVLSSAERSTIGSYLNAKYALAPPPVNPTNLMATALSAGQINLTWDYPQMTVATSFKVERKTGVAGTYAQIASPQDARSYIDTNLTAGTQYYYRIKANTYGMDSDYSNETNATTFASGTDVPLGNLNLWLKADTGLILQNTNGTVQRWLDQSGKTNDATQATGANQPFLVTNVLNSRPVVRFNASSNQFFSLPNVLLDTTQAEAVVVLKVATNVPSTRRSLWRMNTGGGGYPDNLGRIVDDFGVNPGGVVMIPTQPLDQYHVYDASGAANHWSAWINGILQADNTVNTYGFTTTPTLGSDNAFSPTTYFDGDIAEVLIFNRVLSSAERGTIGSYLTAKYALSGIPLAPTNLSANAISAGQISLTWDYPQATAATSFKVERKTGSGTYAQVAMLPDARSYIDTNLTAGTQYYYRIKASTYGGDSDYSNETNATTFASGTDVPLANLNLWLKADTGLILQTTNGTVQRWLDQSGKTNNATQTTGANQPLLVTNVLNSRPVVRFNASSNQFFSLPNVLLNTTQAEAVVVLKVATNVPSTRRSLWRMNTGGGGYPDNLGRIVDDFGNPGGVIIIPTQPLDQYHVYEASGAANHWSAWINGILQADNTVNTYGFTTTPTLGRDDAFSPTTYFDGDIAEVLIFNRVLSNNERAAVVSYINKKYVVIRPIVTLTSPTNNTVIVAGSNLAISATASDAAGTVTQVQFFQGATSLGVVTNSPYSLIWSNVTTGTYSLTAQVTDDQGLTSTSQVVSVIADIPPSVTLTSPTNNTVLAANTDIIVTANATDADGTVTRVEFFQGTNSLGVITGAPFNLTWSNVPPSNYSLTARATDNNGLTTTSSVANVTVAIAPTVVLISPTNNAVFPAGSNITLSANASTAGGSVTLVQFFQGTNNLGIVTNVPYSLVWSNVTAGSYSLTAQATGDDGLVSTSAVVNVTVDALPSISITAPTNNSVIVPAYTNATVIATASDSDGTISQVQFFLGTTLLGTVTNSPYSVTWSNMAPGTYTLSASATDNNGLATTSAVVNVTVAGVFLTSPTNFLVATAPASIPISAAVVDNVGISQMQFFQGATSLGIDTTPPYSMTWSGVTTNVYSLTAVATDTAGRVLTSRSVTVIVDTNPSTTDRNGDGVSDLTAYLLGRNPLATSTVSDTNGVVNLQIYTPLK